jgi:hypothetical protein
MFLTRSLYFTRLSSRMLQDCTYVVQVKCIQTLCEGRKCDWWQTPYLVHGNSKARKDQKNYLLTISLCITRTNAILNDSWPSTDTSWWEVRPAITYYICYFLWLCSPARVMTSFTRFLDHTQRRATVGMTPMDEWSARRRDLYLTTHNTHKNPCPRWDSNPRSQQASGRRHPPYTARPLEPAVKCIYRYVYLVYCKQHSLLHVSANCCGCNRWLFIKHYIYVSVYALVCSISYINLSAVCVQHKVLVK